MTKEAPPIKTKRVDTRKTKEAEVVESIEAMPSKEVQIDEAARVAKESKTSVAMEAIRKARIKEAIERVASMRETIA